MTAAAAPGFLAAIRFNWPGLVFTVTQACVVSAAIWLSSTVTRRVLTRRYAVQDRAELAGTIREKQATINRQLETIHERDSEIGVLRSVIETHRNLAYEIIQDSAVVTGVERREL